MARFFFFLSSSSVWGKSLKVKPHLPMRAPYVCNIFFCFFFLSFFSSLPSLSCVGGWGFFFKTVCAGVGSVGVRGITIKSIKSICRSLWTLTSHKSLT